MALTFTKTTVQLFNLDALSSILGSGHAGSGSSHIWYVSVFFTLNPIRRLMMRVYSLTGDINFNR